MDMLAGMVEAGRFESRASKASRGDHGGAVASEKHDLVLQYPEDDNSLTPRDRNRPPLEIDIEGTAEVILGKGLDKSGGSSKSRAHTAAQHTNLKIK